MTNIVLSVEDNVSLFDVTSYESSEMTSPSFSLISINAPPVAREKFALLIGINYRTNPHHWLVRPHKDVASMKPLLIGMPNGTSFYFSLTPTASRMLWVRGEEHPSID